MSNCMAVAGVSNEGYDQVGKKSNNRIQCHIQSLPVTCMETLLCMLDPADLYHAMLTCRRWYSIIHNRGKYVFKEVVQKALPKATLEDARAVQILPRPDLLLRGFAYAWNPKDLSDTMFVQPDGFTIFRRPVAQCSDAVRGKRGVKEGVHAFDFIWHTPFGTSAAIGLSTKAQHLKCPGYVPFLGASEHSWSWDIVEGFSQWAGKIKPYPTNPNSPPVLVGQRLRMIVDCDRQLVGFERGSEFLGIAFKNLPRDVLVYPTISAVYGQTEVSMYYMGPPLMG